MRDYKLNRRKFLGFLVSLPISLPTLSTFGYVSRRLLSPEESLRKMILLLGPWSATEREKAEDFARRFMKARHAFGPYLPESRKLVQGLASRFPAGTATIKKIDLRKLPPEEQELLMNLTKQLYSFIELRFLVSNEPPWGACQTDDRLRYTRAPKLSKL
ncbi:MAG: hypothetical protein V3U56_13205 [Syntrophobacteria bacterium]